MAAYRWSEPPEVTTTGLVVEGIISVLKDGSLRWADTVGLTALGVSDRTQNNRGRLLSTAGQRFLFILFASTAFHCKIASDEGDVSAYALKYTCKLVDTRQS